MHNAEAMNLKYIRGLPWAVGAVYLDFLCGNKCVGWQTACLTRARWPLRLSFENRTNCLASRKIPAVSSRARVGHRTGVRILRENLVF